MIYFSSDIHYNHWNINSLCKRNFNSVEEMNSTLIANINRKVEPNDDFYFLGDFCWWGDKVNYWNDVVNLRKQINCKNFHWILGNHDHPEWFKNKPLQYFNSIEYYKELNFNKFKLVLFHYPIHSWNGQRRDSINVCGHMHSPKPITGKNRIDVGVDANNFQPLSIDEILLLAKESQTLCFTEV